MIYWCRINDPLQVFASQLFLCVMQSSSPLLRGATFAGCQWGRAPTAVGGSHHPPCPRSEGSCGEPGRTACSPARVGAAVMWETWHSLVTACEHETHLTFPPALIAFIQLIRRKWRKCFWTRANILLYHF